MEGTGFSYAQLIRQGTDISVYSVRAVLRRIRILYVAVPGVSPAALLSSVTENTFAHARRAARAVAQALSIVLTEDAVGFENGGERFSSDRKTDPLYVSKARVRTTRTRHGKKLRDGASASHGRSGL